MRIPMRNCLCTKDPEVATAPTAPATPLSALAVIQSLHADVGNAFAELRKAEEAEAEEAALIPRDSTCCTLLPGVNFVGASLELFRRVGALAVDVAVVAVVTGNSGWLQVLKAVNDFSNAVVETHVPLVMAEIHLRDVLTQLVADFMKHAFMTFVSAAIPLK